MTALADLRNPPIVEVVCGLFFEDIPELDPLLAGQFWASKRSSYPKREIKPPISQAQGLTVSEGIGPIRCWLVSEAGEFIVQVQPDRFYFNWRRRADVYPRFSEHGDREGVLSKALREFEEFSTFMEAQVSVRPTPLRLELTKIDVVEFSTLEDLRRDLPLVEAIQPWTRSPMPELTVRLSEHLDGVDRFVSLSNAFVSPDLGRAVRVETRASRDVVTDDVRATFQSLNVVLNEIFAGLFSKVAMMRFHEGSS